MSAYKVGECVKKGPKHANVIYERPIENVEVVIIDEFSMVSADNLYNLHKRLQEIFFSEEPFGGRSVLLV